MAQPITPISRRTRISRPAPRSTRNSLCFSIITSTSKTIAQPITPISRRTRMRCPARRSTRNGSRFGVITSTSDPAAVLITGRRGRTRICRTAQSPAGLPISRRRRHRPAGRPRTEATRHGLQNAQHRRQRHPPQPPTRCLPPDAPHGGISIPIYPNITPFGCPCRQKRRVLKYLLVTGGLRSVEPPMASPHRAAQLTLVVLHRSGP